MRSRRLKLGRLLKIEAATQDDERWWWKEQEEEAGTKNGCGDTEMGNHANAKSKVERYGQSMKPRNWGIL